MLSIVDKVTPTLQISAAHSKPTRTFFHLDPRFYTGTPPN